MYVGRYPIITLSRLSVDPVLFTYVLIGVIWCNVASFSCTHQCHLPNLGLSGVEQSFPDQCFRRGILLCSVR